MGHGAGCLGMIICVPLIVGLFILIGVTYPPPAAPPTPAPTTSTTTTHQPHHHRE